MTAKALGTKCHMHKTRVSRLVGGLAKRGLVSVKSNPSDRRATLIELTPLGKLAHGECTSEAAKFSRALEDAIPAKDLDTLDKCLRTLSQHSRGLMSMTPYDYPTT